MRALGGPDVPAVGFALGLERFLMMLEAAARDGEAAAPRHPERSRWARKLGPRWCRSWPNCGGTLEAPTYADYEERKLLAHLKNRRP